ncbi:MAG TPA: hypothetical protein VFN37_12470 [Candidatus Baltobacteraceae bacterium]|nr:hypothetical protein [Candidatus Baltobacteraceae bacterium]
MERNIGAPNRRIPPDVQPKGSTSRDLDRADDGSRSDEAAELPDASIVDHD